MNKNGIRGFVIQIVLSSMVGGLVLTSACGMAGLSPPSSPYPADVTARIYATSILRVSFGDIEQATITPKANNVLWVANIYAKNKSYPNPILGTYADWVIQVGNNTYGLPNAMKVLNTHEPMMNVGIGQTGQIKMCFEVLSGLNTGDAQLVYLGQQPYSYGQLVDGGKVTAYDFDANKPVTVSEKTNIATVQRIWVSAIWIGGGSLYVELKPTSNAIANKVYTVELYEKGRLRATATVSWNQPEINVSTMRPVKFPATRQEAEAYGMEGDLRKIFSAKIHE